MPKVTNVDWEKQEAKLRAHGKQSVWAGPESDTENGGATYSLLCRFLSCRERFRLLVVEGLKQAESFNHRIEYGSMWHICEEMYAKNGDIRDARWRNALRNHATNLCKKYPTQQSEIDKYYEACKVQFPIYADYWAKHPDVTDRTPLLQEQTFNVPYKLPSGRVVRLRGKWDSVDLIGKTKPAIYLKENKSKGDVDQVRIIRQLNMDLQVMLYIVAYKTWQELDDYGEPIRFPQAVEHPIGGVIYNVVRRPFSGGKGNIKQHKPKKSLPLGESKEHFFKRLEKVFKDNPEEWFYRWKVEITPDDINTFRVQCLDPILEQLCDWYSWVSKSSNPFNPNDGCENSFDGSVRSWVHYRHPFGVYSPLSEDRPSELDNFLATGDDSGLQRVDNLFPELTESSEQ